MPSYTPGDKVRVRTHRPRGARLEVGDVVHVISHRSRMSWEDEGDETVFVTGPDGKPAEGFEKRGWSVQASSLEPVVEEDGYVPIVGESYAIIDGTFGTLNEVRRCSYSGSDKTDYRFSGPASSFGAVHADRITWLEPVKLRTEESIWEEPEHWEVGKRYEYESISLGVGDFEVNWVDDDGDAYGIKYDRAGSSWKTIRRSYERRNYTEVK